MTVLGLVLSQLVVAILPFWLCAAPAEAKIVKVSDAVIGYFTLLACLALIDHPFSERSLTLRNVAVTVLGLVLSQLVVAILPFRLCACAAPVEVKIVKVSDAVFG